MSYTWGQMNSVAGAVLEAPPDLTRKELATVLNQHTPAPATEQEEWRPIVGWEDLYEVSNLGRVRAIWNRRRTRRADRILRYGYAVEGYPNVTLCRAPIRKHYLVHRLVMAAFVGPCPEGMEVHHEDDNPGNPRLDNLRYVTRDENQQISVARGRAAPHPRPVWSEKLTADDVLAIRASDKPNGWLAIYYGVSPATICDIRKRRTWAHLPEGGV